MWWEEVFLSYHLDLDSAGKKVLDDQDALNEVEGESDLHFQLDDLDDLAVPYLLDPETVAVVEENSLVVEHL